MSRVIWSSGKSGMGYGARLVLVSEEEANKPAVGTRIYKGVSLGPERPNDGVIWEENFPDAFGEPSWRARVVTEEFSASLIKLFALELLNKEKGTKR